MLRGLLLDEPLERADEKSAAEGENAAMRETLRQKDRGEKLYNTSGCFLLIFCKKFPFLTACSGIPFLSL